MVGIAGFFTTFFVILVAALINYLFKNTKHLGNYKSFAFFYAFVCITWIIIFRGIPYYSMMIFGGLYIFYVVLIFFHDLFSKKKVKFPLFSKIFGYSLLVFAFICYTEQFVAINLFLYSVLWLILFGYNGIEKLKNFASKNSHNSNKVENTKNIKKLSGKHISFKISREKKLIYLIVAVIVIIVLAVYIALWVYNKQILTFILWGSLAVVVIGTLITLLIWEKKKEVHKDWQFFLIGVIIVLFISAGGIQLKVNDMNSKFLRAEKAYLDDSATFIIDNDADDVDYDEEDALTKDIKTMVKNNTGKYHNDLTKHIKDYNKIITEYE